MYVRGGGATAALFESVMLIEADEGLEDEERDNDGAEDGMSFASGFV